MNTRMLLFPEPHLRSTRVHRVIGNPVKVVEALHVANAAGI
ncbi:hypothetical protein [Mesorhizobium sp. M9A.F.Ca.ET.002.03.1.2]|nr:hypothetical protein [Mesorhizobium sp. M9A.F.Ca.ET.002.03.1.2]